MDPLDVIRRYKSCKYHPSKSKLHSLSLSSVYKYHTGNELVNAHNSLYDAQAQIEIVTSPNFIEFIDKSNSICSVEDIFTKKQQNEIRKIMEPTRPVHLPWVELRDGDEGWSPPIRDSYEGPQAGGKLGPSSAITYVARTKRKLLDIFFFLFPMSLIHTITHETDKYAYKQ